MTSVTDEAKQVDDLQSIGMGIDAHADLFADADSIYRRVRPHVTSFYSGLCSQGVISGLVGRGLLVKTEISNDSTSDELVLIQPRHPFVSFPHEWTFEMLRDASLVWIDLCLELYPKGLFLQDGHPWNIVFFGSTPRFVDVTSIVPLVPELQQSSLDEWRRYCLASLLLMKEGQMQAARAILAAIFEGVENAVEVARPSRLTPRSFVLKALKRCKRLIAPPKPNREVDPIQELKSLRSLVESLESPQQIGVWTDYYHGKNALPVFQGSPGDIPSIMASTEKHKYIRTFLADKPANSATLLDIGCNRGLYSRYAASVGWTSCAIDMDEGALAHLYKDIRETSEDVTVVLNNLVAPREGYGYWHKPLPTLAKRSRADAVLCLAIVHHWVFGRMRLRFQDVAFVLASLSNTSLVVEFVSPTDEHVSKWMKPEFDWYTLDGFKEALAAYFTIDEVVDSFPAGRYLIRCTRRDDSSTD